VLEDLEPLGSSLGSCGSSSLVSSPSQPRSTTILHSTIQRRYGILVGNLSWNNRFYWQYWCWIHSNYSDHRIAGESFWLWLAFAVAVSLYTPLCFYNVGYISPDENAKWTFKINSREEARAVRTGNLPTSKLMMYVQWTSTKSLTFLMSLLDVQWHIAFQSFQQPWLAGSWLFTVTLSLSHRRKPGSASRPSSTEAASPTLSSSFLHAKTTSFLGNPPVLENLSIYLLPFALVVSLYAGPRVML